MTGMCLSSLSFPFNKSYCYCRCLQLKPSQFLTWLSLYKIYFHSPSVCSAACIICQTKTSFSTMLSNPSPLNGRYRGGESRQVNPVCRPSTDQSANSDLTVSYIIQNFASFWATFHQSHRANRCFTTSPLKHLLSNVCSLGCGNRVVTETLTACRRTVGLLSVRSVQQQREHSRHGSVGGYVWVRRSMHVCCLVLKMTWFSMENTSQTGDFTIPVNLELVWLCELIWQDGLTTFIY